jgi:hypothetical protein
MVKIFAKIGAFATVAGSRLDFNSRPAQVTVICKKQDINHV